MIVNPRITEYIDSLESSQGSLLDSIEEEAREALVPIIRRETGALLRTLITAAAPSNILEIGTAVGYSSLLMCRVMPENCHITTIEKYEKRIPAAGKTSAGPGQRSALPFSRGMRGNGWSAWQEGALISYFWTRPRDSMRPGFRGFLR